MTDIVERWNKTLELQALSPKELIDRHRRWNACGRKVKYACFEDAEAIRGLVNQKNTKVYECQWCDGFHWGHNNKIFKHKVLNFDLSA